MDIPVTRIGSNLKTPNKKEHMPFSGINQTNHAPPGGIDLGGKHFEGGQFIPNSDLEKASPEELKKLEEAQKIAKIYGPKQAKKILASIQRQKAAALQISGNVADNSHPYLYVVDDGSILGKKDVYGSLVLRNNPDTVPTIIPKELSLLMHLQTKRFDIIVPQEQIVYSLYGSFAAGGVEHNKTDENIFVNVTSLPGIQVDKIALKEYNLLNNLGPEIQKAFIPANSAAQQPSLDSANQPSSPELNVGEEQTTINSDVSSPNLLSPTGAEKLSNLSLRSALQSGLPLNKKKTTWLIKDNGINKIYKLSTKEKTKNKLLVHKIYNALKVPTTKLEPDAEGIGTLSEVEPKAKPLDLDDKDIIQKFLKHFVIDVLLNNKQAFGPDGTHVLDINGEPVRSNFDADLDQDEDNIDENTIRQIQQNSKEAGSLLDRVTPDLIDKMLAEAEYPHPQRETVKAIILKRLGKLNGTK